MLDNILTYSRAHVFREVEKEGEVYFEHFQTEDGKSLKSAFILNFYEHLEMLNLD